jgi:hypothetical protein
MEIGSDDGLVIAIIRAGALAGAYTALSREFPSHQGGFEKLRRKHSRAATRLMDEILRADTGPTTPALRPEDRQTRA